MVSVDALVPVTVCRHEPTAASARSVDGLVRLRYGSSIFFDSCVSLPTRICAASDADRGIHASVVAH